MDLSLKDKKTRPPLIMLHGFLGSADNWRRVVKKWEGTYHSVAIDARNHGRSARFKTMTYPEMAWDLEQYCQDHDLQNIHVIGHSMGGKIAMQWAHDFPDRFATLVVVDIAPLDYPPHHTTYLNVLKALDGHIFKTLSQLQAQFEQAGISNDMGLFLSKLFQRDSEGLRLAAPIDTLIEAYPGIMQNIATHKPIKVPAHVVIGDQSNYVTQAGENAFEATFLDVSFHRVPGAGHWLHATHPHVFDQLIGDILS